jgi:hypothetical protein
VAQQWRAEFPHQVSHQRFVEWIPATLLPLAVCLPPSLRWRMHRH